VELVMFNGRKNAIVGLTGLATFILIELSLAVALIAVGADLIFDIDLPFIDN
jgi:hypothetical protein